MANESKTFPLVFRGVVQKVDPGMLDEGQFQDALNISSIQEGAITPRFGSKKFPNSSSVGVVSSMAKLGLGSDATDPRYLGDGVGIHRFVGPYTTPTDVAAGIGISTAPWEAASFDSDGSGKPILYIAHPTRMMRDNGTFSKLQPWGIKPPFVPVTAVPASASIGSGFSLLTDQSSGGTARLAAPTVTTYTLISTDYYQVVLSSNADILPGTYVVFSGSGQYMLVDNVFESVIEGHCAAIPSGTVTAFYKEVILPTTPTIADGSDYSILFTGSVDWSLGGRAENGYDHNDIVNVGLYIDGADDFKEVRVRVFVNNSSSSFYEKAIAPSQSQDFAAGNQTAIANLQAQLAILQQAGPSELDPNGDEVQRIIDQITALSIPPTIAPTWYEFQIAKTDFIKNGNAGSGENTWKNVTSVQIIVKSRNLPGTPTFVVRVGAIYAVGKQGPDSSAAITATGYDWLYTMRDPATGAEGNPCMPMLTSQVLDLTNRAAQLTLYGVSTDALIGNPSIAGYGSIAVYRRGGAFADGLYRFVGYSTNPGVSVGVPQPVEFIDNNSDSSIDNARTIEFDNDAPVTSRQPVPLTATISAISSGAAGLFVQITLTGYSGSGVLSTFTSVGSTVHIGQGLQESEDCIVLSINDGASQITVWIQNSHATSEQVTCDAIVGQPCDVICTTGNNILLAGDVNNPATIYMSKSGRPHAFPLINLASGNSNQISAGSPDNPIYGIAEYNGEYLSMNKSRFFVFSILNGQITQPLELPVTRGLAVKRAWCKEGSRIWYLSYDGIYAWSGGESVKMTTAIDWIFRGQTVGAFAPVDLTATAAIDIFFSGEHVWFLYRDTTGANRSIRYSVPADRWEPMLHRNSTVIGAFTRGLAEEDTGRLIGAWFSNALNKTFIYQMELGSSDGWTTNTNDGASIDFSGKTGFYSPAGKLTQVLLQELVLEILNPGGTIQVQVFYDFSDTGDATDIFTIPIGFTRRRIPLPLQQTAGTAYGKECNSVAIKFSGTTILPLSLYSIGCKWAPLSDVQRGVINDWSDLGHPYDKRLYEVTIEFANHGSAVGLNLDIISGIDGVAKTEDVQQFVLPSSATRGKKTFAITDGVIAKLVRLRPTVTSVNFEIFDVKFVKEDYPADIVRFTEPTDKGSPYDKYIQQLVLDVNTNGQVVPVTIEADGSASQIVNVQSTLSTRSQVKTINPSIIAKKVRITVGTIPAGGMFQLFNADFVVQPADKGPVSHTTDWDILDHPFDKRLRTLTVSYDNMSQGSITLLVDTLSGIAGGTIVSGALTFTLNASGRGQQTFAIPDGVIVKAVKLRPSADNVLFKMWSYVFDCEKYPADDITWTEWTDFGYEHEKILQELAFDVDTGGVAASVTIQADGGNLQTISITSTASTREQIVTLGPSLRGKKFRLLIASGGGGKFQLWKWVPKFEKGDVGPVEHSFDWDDLGTPDDKKLITVYLQYDTSGTPITMLMDTITGINGTTINLAVASFVLSGAARSNTPFTLPVDTIAKMIRIRPATTFAGLKVWKYTFSKINYPADKIPATEPDNVGYGCDKVLRSLTLDMDTGGVDAAVQLQVDGTSVGAPFVVNTNANDRVRILTAPADTIGKLFRLVPTPGSGGKSQVFSVHWDVVREPCCVGRIDTLEICLGGVGWKFVKQMWVEYVCPGPITVSLYVDGGLLLHSETLPAHSRRSVERFTLPDADSSTPKVLNKSKMHRIVIVPVTSTNCIKLWGDSSRIESKLLSGDQRAAYEQHYLSALTSPQIITANV